MPITNSWPESWLREATRWSVEHLGLNESEARTWAESVLAMNIAGIPVSVSDLVRFIDYGEQGLSANQEMP